MKPRSRPLRVLLVSFFAAVLSACAGAAGAVRHSPPRLDRDTAALALFNQGLEALSQAREQDSSSHARAGVRRAAELFEQAVARDSQLAEALGALAETNLLLNLQDDAVRLKSRQSAGRALSLAEPTARAHSALGWLLFFEEQRYAPARRAFLRALALDSTLVLSRFGYGLLLASQGELDRGLAEVERAERSGLIRPNWRFGSEAVLFFARRYREAATRAAQPLTGSPTLGPDYFWMGNALLQLGEPDSAISVLESRVLQSNRAPGAVASLAAAYAAAGREAQARALRAELDSLWRAGRQRGVTEPCAELPCHQFAVAHLAAGEREAAMGWLERSLGFRGVVPWGHWLAVDPRLDPLRGDARFVRVLQRAGHAAPTVDRP